MDVTIDGENPSIAEAMLCCLGIVNHVARCVAFGKHEGEQETLCCIASMILELAAEESEGKKNGSVEQRV